MNAAIIEPGCHYFGRPGIVMCGPGGVLIRGRRDCPECGRKNARSLTRWPSSLYWGTDDHCECGDNWQDGERLGRPFARGWREKAQRRFEADWVNALPEGSSPNYSHDGGAMLESVTLPDGTETR